MPRPSNLSFFNQYKNHLIKYIYVTAFFSSFFYILRKSCRFFRRTFFLMLKKEQKKGCSTYFFWNHFVFLNRWILESGRKMLQKLQKKNTDTCTEKYIAPGFSEWFSIKITYKLNLHQNLQQKLTSKYCG